MSVDRVRLGKSVEVRDADGMMVVQIISSEQWTELLPLIATLRNAGVVVINENTPLAKAILGKEEGSQVVFKADNQQRQVTVVSVESKQP